MRTCAQCSVDYPDALEFCPRDGSKLPPLPGGTRALYDPLLGATIDGRYLVEAVLGQGGMGVVYAARHAIIEKRVAIKVLRKEAAQEESNAERFIAEARAASKIGHQNIVDITDYGVLKDGHAYFVMEFLDGPTLAKLVTEGPLDQLRAVGITIQVARGLYAAHQKGIVHRDLKPENVFVLERDGQKDVVKIVDFGIAKDARAKKRLTQIGMVLGTPEYMSPEQASGKETDHRVDIYALGCLLHEMITGEVPFRGENPVKTLTMHVFDPVVPPSERRPDLAILPALEAVVMRTLEKEPQNRYASLKDMMSILDGVEAELRSQVATPGRRSSADFQEITGEQELLSARRRTGWWAGVTAGAAAVAVLVGVLVSHRPTPAPPARAGAPASIAAPPPMVVAPPGEPRARLAPRPTTEVEVALSTNPPGAEIWKDGTRLGTTPYRGQLARTLAPVTFVFRHRGYQEASRQVVPDRDREIEAMLIPRRARLKATKTAAPRQPAAQAESPSPSRPPARKNSDLRNPFE